MKELGRAMADSLGVYISVPFCRAKCTFCNFASGVFGVERMQAYVNRVCAEMRGARVEAARLGAEMPDVVDTVYFGGGTPSLLSADQMRELFGALRGEFTLAGGAEITLECAPGQLSDETLEELLRQGMNRISFGVQSFVDREAAAVGRMHTRSMCLGEIARVRAAGVEEVSVDLIVGLPWQTAESWRESVKVLVESGVPHASVYMLEVDEESRLGKEVLVSGGRYGAGAVPCEDEMAAWYAAGSEWLEEAGLRQYEISNFARAGHGSRHNVKYWRREPYAGFGLDAHSMLRTGVGAVRRANVDDLDAYLGSGGEADGASGQRLFVQHLRAPEVNVVGMVQAFEEALFLGLRMNVGVDLEELRMEFGEALVGDALAAVEDVEEAGLVERANGRLRLTGAGRMVSNEVFERLLVAVV